MTTYIRKDVQGNWKAVTDLDISPTKRLKLATYKTSSGALVTIATVSPVDGDWETHEVYKDFSKRLECSKYPRITSKVVETQHARYDIAAIVEEVKAFYNL